MGWTAVVYSWQLLVVGTGLAQTRTQTLHPSCATAGRLDFALHVFCVHVFGCFEYAYRHFPCTAHVPSCTNIVQSNNQWTL